MTKMDSYFEVHTANSLWLRERLVRDLETASQAKARRISMAIGALDLLETEDAIDGDEELLQAATNTRGDMLYRYSVARGRKEDLLCLEAIDELEPGLIF